LKVSVSLERLARNQILFREVNERLREMLDESVGATEFLCECSNQACTETLALGLDEYEAVRASPNLFVVVRGHEIPTIERVVGEADNYKLVEKFVGAEDAVKSDPRARGE
jgi:aerobic-type carbon monoxide dehydrogenase small subunit (CoxS/CutS family)